MAEFTETITRTVNCPYCDNAKVVKNGTQAGKQRYRCKGCSKQFNDSGAVHGYRTPSNQVGAAVRLYYSGLSYKQIGENMADMFDIDEPDKAAIYHWVRENTDTATAAMADYPAHTGGLWVADEMTVKVGGETLWNWNVMDHKTRYVLASHLTRNRDTRAAVAVLRKAAQAAATPPKAIKTDRLGSYGPAIKQVFPEAKHIQSNGIRAIINNNRSERLQGTIRDREKTLRGLDSLESGQRYLDGWTLNYNLFREHESLDGQTPGEEAKVKPPFTEWEDVVRAGPALREKGKGRGKSAARLVDPPEPEIHPSNVVFVPGPTLRRRPKGETDADKDDGWFQAGVEAESKG